MSYQYEYNHLIERSRDTLIEKINELGQTGFHVDKMAWEEEKILGQFSGGLHPEYFWWALMKKCKWVDDPDPVIPS